MAIVSTGDVRTQNATLGRIKNVGIVRVDIRLEWKEREAGYQTTEHEQIPGYWEFAVMGSVWRRTNSLDCESAGQIIDEVSRLRTPLAQRLVKLWREWHLNGMSASCSHQPPFRGGHTSDVPPCVITGYRCGTAWLVRVIPDDIVDEIRQLIKDINEI